MPFHLRKTAHHPFHFTCQPPFPLYSTSPMISPHIIMTHCTHTVHRKPCTFHPFHSYIHHSPHPPVQLVTYVPFLPQWQRHPAQPGTGEGVPGWQPVGGRRQGKRCWQLHLYHQQPSWFRCHHLLCHCTRYECMLRCLQEWVSGWLLLMLLIHSFINLFQFLSGCLYYIDSSSHVSVSPCLSLLIVVLFIHLSFSLCLCLIFVCSLINLSISVWFSHFVLPFTFIDLFLNFVLIHPMIHLCFPVVVSYWLLIDWSICFPMAFSYLRIHLSIYSISFSGPVSYLCIQV